MNKDLFSFASRMRALISDELPSLDERQFTELALELFGLQFAHNPAYRKICEGRKLTPQVTEHWTQIPSVPTSAFKELELTSIAPGGRVAVFYSSGTTEQKPSRHFHSAESRELYEASLWSGFSRNVLDDSKFKTQNLKLICLTPAPEHVPHSSLVHMFETVRQRIGAPKSVFVGKLGPDGSWTLDLDALAEVLRPQNLEPNHHLILGTAFSFVHLLDWMAEKKLRLVLPENSRVMETGGYKNRSRSLPKAELHTLITKHLGVPAKNIICEYGMSELSSQAYDSRSPGRFSFPSWTRVQVISPESGREVPDGETGLIRIYDLANVFSVSAIQTEDLGIRRGVGFDLVGRAKLSEARGCSLMAA